MGEHTLELDLWGALMRGYVAPTENHDQSNDWLSLCAEAVGTVIEFWGFKRNHGRVWALLYVTDSQLTALEIQERLGLSKGGVSMMTRELETWGVIRRVRAPSQNAWRFEAETDLIQMLSNVITERESVFVARICSDLERAERLAKSANVPPEQLKRVRRMLRLGRAVDKAIGVFMRTARLDFRALAQVLVERKRRA